MGFTRSTTPTDVHQNMPDYPSDEGYTTTQLKTAFDAPATGLKSDINGLEGELEATTAAASLGAAPITAGDSSSANVQAKLEKLYQDLQDAALGEIPDNSIDEVKLVSNYSSLLAKKDGGRQVNLNADMIDGYHASSLGIKNGSIQTNLNAEKLGGSTLAQVKSAIQDRSAASETSFTIAHTSSSQTVIKTISNIKTRYLLFIVSEDNFSTGSSGYHNAWGIYDCRNKNFIVQGRTTGDYTYFYYLENTLKVYSSGGYISGTTFSNGTLTLTVEVSSVKNFYIKCYPLDGLLP